MAFPTTVTISTPEIEVEVKMPADFLNTKELDEKLGKTMSAIANEAKTFWETEAGRRLKSSRKEYQDAIQMNQLGPNSFMIGLGGGFLPHAVEVGKGPYSMNVKRGQIVPLNINRDVEFSNPEKYVTGTGDPWTHPGFPGVNIAEDVKKELNDKIIPKHMDKLMKEVL